MHLIRALSYCSPYNGGGGVGLIPCIDCIVIVDSHLSSEQLS